jgi:diguanylate cyclase (GGDEF)-like protein
MNRFMMNLSRPRERSSLDALRVFHEVARAITSSIELDSILRTILDQMASFFQPQSWSLLMLDEARQELFYAIAVGHPEDELRDVRIPMGHGAAGWAAQHGESLLVEDIAADPRFANSPLPRLINPRKGPQSVLCIPVQARNRSIAVIQLVNSRPEGLDDFDMYFLHVLTDYTAIAIENSAAMDRIRELTITDDCTGLFNARHLHKMLESEVERSIRTKDPFSLIFIDLDHFKSVNDTHGHLIGSQLLAEVGTNIKNGLRQIDSAYRYGGDEFVAMLPHTPKPAAIEVARRLYRNLRGQPFLNAENINVNVRASFGLATFPEDGGNMQDLIRSADEMMYLVKNTCRDNIAVAGLGLIGPPVDPAHADPSLADSSRADASQPAPELEAAQLGSRLLAPRPGPALHNQTSALAASLPSASVPLPRAGHR